MTDHQLGGGDYVFLAFLARGPMSAYDVKKEMGSSVNFFWSAQHSQVYQQARRLQRDGYIEPRGTSGSRNRTFLAITTKGRSALDAWLQEPTPLYRIFDQSLAKLYFGGLAGSDATERMLEDQRRQHAELLEQFERIRSTLEAVDYGEHLPYQLYTLRLGIEVENGYLRWIDETIADLRRRGRSSAPTRRAGRGPSPGAAADRPAVGRRR